MHREIMDAIEVLDPPFKALLKKYGVKIEKMEDVYPGDVEKMHFMGAYDWGRNKIFIPKKVLQNGDLTDNFDVDFVLRHETGHAFNSKVLENPALEYIKPKRISDKSTKFIDAFNKDLASLSDDVLKDLRFDKSTEAGLQFARDEIFADTFAHASGFPTKNPWSILVKDHFGNTLALMKEKFRD